MSANTVRDIEPTNPQSLRELPIACVDDYGLGARDLGGRYAGGYWHADAFQVLRVFALRVDLGPKRVEFADIVALFCG